MNMDMTFPEDMHDVDVRNRRNISETERWASMSAGATMVLYGLSRRSTTGWVFAGFGAWLFQRGASGRCRTYDWLGINTSNTASDTRRVLGGEAGAHVDESVTINRPLAELYKFWRNLENLPRVMTHLASVEQLTETISRWRAKGPAGTHLEWTAEIINEVPNQVIGWRSIESSDVVSAGSVNFDEAGAGRTRLRVRLQYSPPGGKAGAALASLVGRDAATEIHNDLNRFKQLIESGEIATSL
jgi:uncharacterized membrane protein